MGSHNKHLLGIRIRVPNWDKLKVVVVILLMTFCICALLILWFVE
jgi:hypothetical protein